MFMRWKKKKKAIIYSESMKSSEAVGNKEIGLLYARENNQEITVAPKWAEERWPLPFKESKKRWKILIFLAY